MYDKLIPKCRDCGNLMIEICTTGTRIEFGEEREFGLVDMEGKEYGRHKQWFGGARFQKLYQCPEDKTIAVD